MKMLLHGCTGAISNLNRCWRVQRVPITDEGGKMALETLSIGTLFLEPILAALIDVYHRKGGVNWPASLARYDVYVVDLQSGQVSKEVHEVLMQQGLSVLLDDRAVSQGVKFTDADLVDCFLRVTVSPRNLKQGGVELVCLADRKQIIEPAKDIA